MKIDYVLILAAGQGTRMGNIGKVLPKVLWPLFERTLLELQVEYAKREFDCEKVFINVFNHKETILNFIKSSRVFKNVTVLEEQEILDVGGAVHNLANAVGYKGSLLILNADQFIMYDRESKDRLMSKYSSSDGVLGLFEVNSSALYNEIVTSNEKIIGLRQNKNIERDKTILTYTGNSLVNLERLTPVAGKSKFFDTVVSFNENIFSYVNLTTSPYWDFGTIERYYQSMFNILRAKNSKFFRFLLSAKAIDPDLIREDSYNSKFPNCINMSKGEGVRDSIIISDRNEKLTANHFSYESKIIYQDIVQYLVEKD